MIPKQSVLLFLNQRNKKHFMKKFLTVFLAAILMITVKTNAQADSVAYTIRGNLSGVKKPVTKVLLTYINGTKRSSDSSVIQHNEFSFSGYVYEPVVGTLTFRIDTNQFKQLFPGKPVVAAETKSIVLDKGAKTIQCLDSFTLSRIKGSHNQRDFDKLTQALAPVFDTITKLGIKSAEAVKQGKREEQFRYLQLAREFTQKSNDIYLDFIKKNPDHDLANYYLGLYAGINFEESKLRPVFDQLSPRVKNFISAKTFAGRMQLLAAVNIGNSFPDSVQSDINNQPLSISKLKGKTVLVCYWGAFMPHAIDQLNTFNDGSAKWRDNGFEILGIGLTFDSASHATWKKTVTEKGWKGYHMTDKKGFANSLMRPLGLTAVPYFIVVDKAGKIISRNFSYDVILKYLKYYFK